MPGSRFGFVKSGKTDGNAICSQPASSDCLLGKSVGMVKKYNVLRSTVSFAENASDT